MDRSKIMLLGFLLLLGHHSQQLVDSPLRVESLWTGHRAHSDILAFLQLQSLCQVLQPLLGVLVPRIDDPPVGLHQDGRTEVLVRMPPVRRTRGRAASTEDALIQPIKFLAVFNTLKVLPLLNKTQLTPSSLGPFRLRYGWMVLYCEQKLVISTTRSLSTNMWPSGVMSAGLLRSLSISLMQAKVCRPSQFIAHDPQIPSLQERRKASVESKLSLTYSKASRYMGGIFLRSIQQLTYLGSSLGFSGSYLQIKNLFILAFSSAGKLGSFSTIQLGLRYPFTVDVTLSKKTEVSFLGMGE